MLKFTVLSHACLLVEYNGTTLLCDPWLLGSCYWRSWWNYPPVKKELYENLKPDYIYITHIHWDHFQGPSLRKFSKDTPIIIPKDRYNRMYVDLKKMGFTNVMQLPHGKKYNLRKDFFIRNYHFSFISDSALIIDTPDCVLLNANDAKIMGLPLRQLMRQNKKIDFVFRSHSSANGRLCYQCKDEPELIQDDNERYVRTFSHFVKKIKPKYVIPFASNTCHLHKDTFKFNPFVQTPQKAAESYAKFKEQHHLDTELKIMLSGDSWSTADGFKIEPNDYFEHRDEHLLEYQRQQQPKLDKYYAREEKVTVTKKNMEKYFFAFSKALPFFLRWIFRKKDFYFIVKSGDEERTVFKVNVYNRKIEELSSYDEDNSNLEIYIPAIILKQAMAMNMFAHADISKRVEYRYMKADYKYLKLLIQFMMLYEHEAFPLRKLFNLGLFKSYRRRWRELLFYFSVAKNLLLGRKITELEIRYLK